MELLMRGFIILIVYFNYRKSLDSVPSFWLKTVQIIGWFYDYPFGSRMLDIQIRFSWTDFQWFPLDKSRPGLDSSLVSVGSI